MEQIPQNVAQTLDVLAERFGSTGAHLWEVMVRQQVIEAWVTLILVLLLATSTTVAWYMSYLAYRKVARNVLRDCVVEKENIFAVAVGLSIVLFVCLPLAVSEVTTGLLNPEYDAIQEVLKTIK